MASRVVSFDPGTAFFQTAEKINDKIDIKIVRNCFVELDSSFSDVEDILKQNKWQYIKDGKKYFVLGESSMKLARIFPDVVLRRPMQNGILNKKEKKNMLIVSKIIEELIGEAPDDTSMVCFCISSEAVDTEIDSVFHKSRLNSMFSRLGWKTKIISEANAIILSERPITIESNGEESFYTGIGCSLGAGKVNISLCYKGLEVVGMSATRSGDWIDQKVEEQTDFSLSQIIYEKENNLDFNNINFNNDIQFSLDVYYSNMLEYVFKNFTKKFQKVKSQFEYPLPIILAGGTACPPGFKEKVENVLKDLELPFKIKEIIISKDPKNSVVRGLLVQAIISQKKLIKNEEKKKKLEEEKIEKDQ